MFWYQKEDSQKISDVMSYLSHDNKWMPGATQRFKDLCNMNNF